MAEPVAPVVLFAYARPDLLRRTLAALRENAVPLVYVFCDGPRSQAVESFVREAREMVRRVDWCEKVVVERETNLGLGASILAGVGEVLSRHESAIVFEDDIVCSAGTYLYMTAALERYKDDPRVMSVAAWTHPRVRPPIPAGLPYFDGRFACWGWGTWRRAWQGMDTPAMTLLNRCRLCFQDVYRYGSDIPEMAFLEKTWNIWAVRFILCHFLHRGLCFHPPHSLSMHIGYDERSSYSRESGVLGSTELQECPLIPTEWPEPEESRECAALWQAATGGAPTIGARMTNAWRHTMIRLRYKKAVLSRREIKP